MIPSILSGTALLVALGLLTSWWAVAAVIAAGVCVWIVDVRTWPRWRRPW